MLYYILSFITLMGSIAWTPIKNDNTYSISQSVLHSSFLADYGNDALIRRFINLNSNIFSGGDKVLLPKNITIVETPDNLRLIKAPINLSRYDWYTALYSQGPLKDQWKRLKQRVYSSFGINKLVDLNKDKIKTLAQKDPKISILEQKKRIKKVKISDVATGKGEAKTLPVVSNGHKSFLSYIVIETEGGDYKILPVVLRLSPRKKIENYISKRAEGGKR